MNRSIVIALLSTYACGSIHAHDIDLLSAESSTRSGLATVTVFRTASKTASIRSFSVIVDGVKMGSIRQKQYLKLDMPAGVHTIMVRCSLLCDLPDIKIKAGFHENRNYYFTTEPGFEHDDFTMTFKSSLRQISQVRANELFGEFQPGKLKRKR